jgi:hypothetical protein
LISVGAHFLLYLAVIHSASIREPQKAVLLQENLISIRLIPPEIILSTKSADFDDLKEAISKQPSDQALPVEPLQDIASPSVEILALAPPKPYYFPTRKLTEIPRGSFDIPSELASLLAGDAPRSATLRLQINENGELDQVIVDASSFSMVEQQLLIEMFQKKKFEAGKIGDQFVKSEMSIEILIEKRELIPLTK